MTDPFEDAFAAALADPAAPVPPGITAPSGAPSPRRFAVYRNTHAVTLAEALAAAYPVSAALVGPAFFAGLARAYRRAHPPATPILADFGAHLADFLAGFEPAAALPYLPDVARLERALLESAHSADATPLAAAELAALAPDRLFAARLTLAPALRLLTSPFPALAIWRAHQPGGAPPGPDAAGEAILVTRPAFDPLPTAVPPATFAALSALAGGATVGEAARHADLTLAFTLLLEGGAITSVD